MRWGAHQRIGGYIAKICKLDTVEMVEGSVYPDKVGMKKIRDNNPYGVDFSYPHHKNATEKVRKLILELRKQRLRGEIHPFYLGALTHLIADRWCYSYDAGRIFDQFENCLEKVEINPRWSHVGIMDGKILNVIPYRYPFQGFGPKPGEREAMKGAFQDCLITIKSILSNIYPPPRYWNYYHEAENSLEKQNTLRGLYWLLTYLHPLFLVTAILQVNTLAEKNMVIKYARAKNDVWKNIGVAIFGCFIALFYPIFWLCILPFIGQFITIAFKIRDEIRRNVDWYIWA